VVRSSRSKGKKNQFQFFCPKKEEKNHQKRKEINGVFYDVIVQVFLRGVRSHLFFPETHFFFFLFYLSLFRMSFPWKPSGFVVFFSLIFLGIASQATAQGEITP